MRIVDIFADDYTVTINVFLSESKHRGDRRDKAMEVLDAELTATNLPRGWKVSETSFYTQMIYKFSIDHNPTKLEVDAVISIMRKIITKIK